MSRREASPPPKQFNRTPLTALLPPLLVLLITPLLLSLLLTSTPFFGYRLHRLLHHFRSPITLTPSELKLYNGSSTTLPIYLALNKTIYDVSSNRDTYGPGGPYGFFAGRDASRAFVTGCFESDLRGYLGGSEWVYVPKHIKRPRGRGVSKHRGSEEDGAKEGENTRGGGDVGERDDDKGKETRDDKETKEAKLERERALRLARKQVRETIEGWQKVFRGETGKDYFEVGRLVDVDEEEDGGEALCEEAERARPEVGMGRDRGRIHRGG